MNALRPTGSPALRRGEDVNREWLVTWLATWRRHRAAWRGERAWKRDRRRHPDVRIALRDEQIAGLRNQVAALTAENARLKVATAAAVMGAGLERHYQQGRQVAARLDGPTVVMHKDHLRRPAPATEQYRRPR